MTIHWFIVGCIAFVILAGVVRRRPADGLANMVVMVALFAALALADLIASQFMHTGKVGLTVGAFAAFGFALDALYGLMAPQRQRRRDRRVRSLIRRRRAA